MSENDDTYFHECVLAKVLNDMFSDPGGGGRGSGQPGGSLIL